jgi:putative transposase
VLKAFVYRLYPTQAQEATLLNTLNLTRELYNAALQERRDAYQKCGKSVTKFEQMRYLPEIKAARPEFKGVHAHVLQGVITQLDKAFQGFFRRVKVGQNPGYPRFKGAHRWHSFAFKQVWDNSRNAWFGPGKLLGSGRIYLPNIGNVRMRQHRPLEGKPKTLTIKREGSEWYATYVCEVGYKPLPQTGNEVGIDLGTNPNFLITSDGEFVAAPRYYRATERKLKTAQRSLGKKRRGSKRRDKARARVAKLHCKVRRQRKDFHHKNARKLVIEHDAIFHEKLNIAPMARSRLAKSVHDAGWSQFLAILSFKAEEAGRRVVGVNPRYTSQDCSSCRHRQKVPIGKLYVCAQCGAELNRDVNAALNVLLRGQGLPVSKGMKVASPRRPEKPPALVPQRVLAVG